MQIGILAVQGAFVEHRKKLESLGAECIELRKKSDLKHHLDGLVLPGGESTVQGKLLLELDLLQPLKQMIEQGTPVLATCAGLILLAERLVNDPHVYFGTLPVTVRRNGYGRQLGSFYTVQEMKEIGSVSMTFIRAPYIEKVGENVEILAEHEGKIVAVRYGMQFGLAFHPELDEDNRIHELFLSVCETAILKI
ncbi:MAG: pyridoxal 5'-phosphate synthase glutaminase subunit PdxT [Eubacteriales bacterium]|nr:pyridoxal 5'-phosphate synthase glutaminase subunit PdxT [Eubacteriales bacterium]